MSDFDTFRRRVQGELFAGLPAHISRLRWDAGQIAAAQRSRLRMLLAHAISGSPFHARRLLGEYACLATGGSSGRRGVFVSDASALTEFLSLLLRPSAARRAAAGGALS